jgi:hypothetical protein
MEYTEYRFLASLLLQVLFLLAVLRLAANSIAVLQSYIQQYCRLTVLQPANLQPYSLLSRSIAVFMQSYSLSASSIAAFQSFSQQ